MHSSGAILPLQYKIFPANEHLGRIFRNNAIINIMGLPQLSAVTGLCVAGGAYLPIMSDEAIIVEGTGSIFLAGSYLVKAAIGEEIDNETLGGADTHNSISGVADYKAKDDADALSILRKLMALQGQREKAGFDRAKSVNPSAPKGAIYSRM